MSGPANRDGRETAMYIRGIRTMNSGARNPLIIVDNVERDLSFLDAFPIENITILKDAAATAIYGMRGANGAILVTTKRGETGKTKIDFTQSRLPDVEQQNGKPECIQQSTDYQPGTLSGWKQSHNTRMNKLKCIVV